jgi:hypothetical protein
MLNLFSYVFSPIIKLVHFSGRDWSEEAIDAFERLTYAAQWKKLLARLVRFETKTGADLIPNSRPAVDLVDANSSQVIIKC